MTYYAVAKGHNVGIYNFWNDAKEQVLNYKGAILKSFNNKKDAEDFILNLNSCSSEIFESIYTKYDMKEVDYYVYTDGSCYNNGNINSKKQGMLIESQLPKIHLLLTTRWSFIMREYFTTTI